jgi:predicted flavoprotein YhiN
MAQLKNSERAALVTALTKYPLSVTGSEGYKKAEVTGGGVPLEQVQCSTMESRVSEHMCVCERPSLTLICFDSILAAMS